ncbi:MAG: hypothetical protein LAT68_14050 [Cyclobacteriaceae bacterium]|nr:hypothetical protein [Cyclobacteriaceae bacterium]MCH8517443.1 hypothetical protein [Cyclobacteriaceae bacterium]
MNKLPYFLVIFIFLSSPSTAQQVELNSQVPLYISAKISKEHVSGTFSNRNSYRLGFAYQRKMLGNFYQSFGIAYQSNDLWFDGTLLDNGQTFRQNEQFSTLHFPVLIGYSPLSFIYIEAGPSLHLDLRSKQSVSIDDQTGVSFILKAGLQYKWRFIEVFGGVFFEEFNLIMAPFSDRDRLSHGALEFGFRVAFP